MQRVDLELSSELEENPINPAFLHLSAPLVSGYDPMFYISASERKGSVEMEEASQSGKQYYW